MGDNDGMSVKPSRRVAVVLERRPVTSRWVDHEWVALALEADSGDGAVTESQIGDCLRRRFPGFELTLYPDEAEGYYLNVSSGASCSFVSLRTPEEGGDPEPFLVTGSYNEAARWMDGGERVERVDVDRDTAQWIEDWVCSNYKPEPKKRQRPRSFEGKEGRFRERGQ